MFSSLFFELEEKFIFSNCLSTKCPFLAGSDCLNFTKEGVQIRRKKWSKDHLKDYGCHNVLLVILENKDFFIGKQVVYSDGSDEKLIKWVTDLEFDLLKRNKFSILVMSKKDKIPFRIPFNTNYLSIEILEDNIFMFTDTLSGLSMDILDKKII